jgi:hypothetical protein
VTARYDGDKQRWAELKGNPSRIEAAKTDGSVAAAPKK